MGTQTRITTAGPLLDTRGHLAAPGYATEPLRMYERDAIAAPWYRIKEWDYYAVLSAEGGYGIGLTLADLGYLGLASLVWLDLDAGRFDTVDRLSLLPRGRMGLAPHSGPGQVTYTHPKLRITYETRATQRRLLIDAPGFRDHRGRRGLSGELVLAQPLDDTMVIATSWPENRRAFYYNQKINCMPATGTIEIGGEPHPFAPEQAFGVLDWGRGHWTYKNRWYWASASGLAHGQRVGWNLGYGFSDRSVATENMVFVDGVAHKLDEVTFELDRQDFLKPWRFTSNDRRFEMDFEPILDRHSTTNLLFIKSIQHQVFGWYRGTFTLDDGTVVPIERMLGFAEDVLNWW